MIEYQLVKRHIPNGFLTRLVYRTTYIVLVGFIAITLPFFGGTYHKCLQCYLVKALNNAYLCCMLVLYAASLYCVQHDENCTGVVCSKAGLQCLCTIKQACLMLPVKVL